MSVIMLTLATPNPNGAEANGRYAPTAMEILTKAGGNRARKMKVVENLVGDVTAGAVLMMEFPSAEAAKSALDSDAYKALLPDRAKAYTSLSILLVQDM